MLREFFGNDNSKRVQAQLVAKYLLHELYCIQVGCSMMPGCPPSCSPTLLCHLLPPFSACASFQSYLTSMA
jgi:hypothetical protein